MRVHLLCLTATVFLALSGIVNAAPPLDLTQHHDEKKSIPAEEYGAEDEEVRQLLDLKGLAAQRDLGDLKRGGHSTDATSAPPSSSSSSASSSSSGTGSGSEVSEKKPKPEPETPKDKEETGVENTETAKTISSMIESHTNQERPEAIDQRGSDQVPLKRQQISRPHLRYTPLDLALYVYKTGDEEGVTLAIQELIVEGLMTPEEALNYLREIRENLRYLNLQEEQEQGRGEDEDITNMGLRPLVKKNSLPLPLTEMSLGDPETMMTPDEDYSFLLERLRNQEYVSTENSLEDVVYQLAKIVFKQAMSKDISSEKALQEVAALLEKETARGAITPDVEKKVLDIIVNSLVDSMSENDFPSGPGPMIGGSNFKLANQSPFSLGDSSPLVDGPSFKHRDLFELSKTTTKREAPNEDEKKTTEEKN